ncbi:universal stress protein [Neolewinella antarctica]|uniref:Nucleotide-binding universal stress UspA family protein n=1 Tax=Neolewinella antarctica TaxID=442734 RepID=A0ABX0X9I4_9BACT|nr:universal stress protein [Neolewinella antarctica]NJC25589.1 nucleotide-binding universal stress UspA family protein [Neolewinella antarctica]
MQSIDSILVPLDLSKVSANALRYALRLADQLDAGIDLLHVVPDDNGSLLSVSLTAQHVENSKEKMMDFFTQAVTATSGQLQHIPAVQSYAVVGNVRATILRHAKNRGTGLIVMGTDGADDFARSLFGTNTSHLVNKAVCPVLIVPKGFAFRPLHSICYATDLTHINTFKAGFLVKTLRVFEPRLDFVHVKQGKDTKAEFDIALLRQLFDRPGSAAGTGFHVLKNSDVAEEIFAYAEANNSDLVVMHRPHHGWLSRLFFKSTTHDAALETTRPLLILPDETDE